MTVTAYCNTLGGVVIEHNCQEVGEIWGSEATFWGTICLDNKLVAADKWFDHMAQIA